MLINLYHKQPASQQTMRSTPTDVAWSHEPRRSGWTDRHVLGERVAWAHGTTCYIWGVRPTAGKGT